MRSFDDLLKEKDVMTKLLHEGEILTGEKKR